MTLEVARHADAVRARRLPRSRAARSARCPALLVLRGAGHTRHPCLGWPAAASMPRHPPSSCAARLAPTGALRLPRRALSARREPLQIARPRGHARGRPGADMRTSRSGAAKKAAPQHGCCGSAAEPWMASQRCRRFRRVARAARVFEGRSPGGDRAYRSGTRGAAIRFAAGRPLPQRRRVALSRPGGRSHDAAQKSRRGARAPLLVS
jgi:hypothetical protein